MSIRQRELAVDRGDSQSCFTHMFLSFRMVCFFLCVRIPVPGLITPTSSTVPTLSFSVF